MPNEPQNTPAEQPVGPAPDAVSKLPRGAGTPDEGQGLDAQTTQRAEAGMRQADIRARWMPTIILTTALALVSGFTAFREYMSHGSRQKEADATAQMAKTTDRSLTLTEDAFKRIAELNTQLNRLEKDLGKKTDDLDVANNKLTLLGMENGLLKEDVKVMGKLVSVGSMVQYMKEKLLPEIEKAEKAHPQAFKPVVNVDELVSASLKNAVTHYEKAYDPKAKPMEVAKEQRLAESALQDAMIRGTDAVVRLKQNQALGVAGAGKAANFLEEALSTMRVTMEMGIANPPNINAGAAKAR